MPACTECTRLEEEYKITIADIHLLLNRRLNNPSEKIRQLHRMQDERDVILRKLSEHKKMHAPRLRVSSSGGGNTRKSDDQAA